MTTEEVKAACLKKVHFTILQMLPKPDCPQKKLKWNWQVDEVKRKIANELSPQGMGIKIEI